MIRSLNALFLLSFLAIGPVDDWIAFNNWHSRVAIISASGAIKIESTWELTAPCEVKLVVTDYGVSVSTSTYLVRLADLDPVGRVSDSTTATDPVTVAFEVSSGDPVVHISTGKRTSDVSRFVFWAATPRIADSARTLGEAAIRACGGRESTPDQRAAQEQRLQALRRTGDSLLGHNLDPSLRRTMIDRCQSAIKGTLRAPGTATFDSVVTVIPSSDKYIVMGSVEAENSYGGRLAKHYVCILEKYGEQWTSKPPLLY